MRTLYFFAAAFAAAVLPLSGADQTAAVVEQYCQACHNATVATRGLSFADLDPAAPAKQPEAWESIVKKLAYRHMPPVGMPRPDEATYEAVVDEIAGSLDAAADAHPNPGRTATFRRLNRTEYRNAIRDLLHLDVDVSSLLPRDESSNGFDNITVGELSPMLMEGYLNAAHKISRLAVGGPLRDVGGELILVPADLTQEQHAPGLPFGTRGGTAVSHNFPLDGEYEIRMTLSRDRDEQVEGLRGDFTAELALDGKRIGLFPISPPESRDHSQVDKDLHVRIPVTAGPHEISATFLKKSAALLETERQPYLARFNMDRHPRAQPAVYSISITGPYDAAGPGETPSRERIFTCRPAQASEEGACAKQVIAQLARRGYRRPVTASDTDQLMRFYEQGREERGFEGGIEMALRALLASPEFLFRIERDPAGVAPKSAYRVSDLALASRLSFFLWSSIPDDELLEVAERGELRKPEILEKQVRRMLADARSQSLIDSFAGQWLYLRNLDSVNPDRRIYPDFDENLRQAFRRETELLFETIVREDRPLVELIGADYTFLNERLAKHYGIPHVYGSQFRRVQLPTDSHRGGLLTQASVLSVTSYANRTSPVVRGKWILTNIMGTPPPPPPPDVPPLKEKSPSGKKLSGRELLAEHRANPLCASCHNTLDPVGLALENYDAIGRWRNRDDGVPVDASGVLPDGSPFDGPEGFRQALLARPELFVATASEKMLTYALGRGLEYYDMPAIRDIVSHAAEYDYRFSAIVLGIVESTPFQMRMSQ
jgi:mono/diheme cytochrome c family protein